MWVALRLPDVQGPHENTGEPRVEGRALRIEGRDLSPLPPPRAPAPPWAAITILTHALNAILRLSPSLCARRQHKPPDILTP